MTTEIVKQRIRLGDKLLGPTNIRHRIWIVEEILNRENLVLLASEGTTWKFNMEYLEEFFFPWVNGEIVSWSQHHKDAHGVIAHGSISVGAIVFSTIASELTASYTVSMVDEDEVEITNTDTLGKVTITYRELEKFYNPQSDRTQSLLTWKEYADEQKSKKVNTRAPIVPDQLRSSKLGRSEVNRAPQLKHNQPTGGRKMSQPAELNDLVRKLTEKVEFMDERLVLAEREVEALKNELYS